jgi:fluoroquinolone transport system ATP-binding protein
MMIDVRNLFHSYSNDQKYAVEDLTFCVEKGEIFGFLGPSGAGKSTTQNILTGLLPLQQGEVSIAGCELRKAGRELFERIGVSFERANHYRRLTGRENLEFFARLYSVPTEEPMKLLRMVGLADAAQQRAGRYSKGMYHRLNFARSMLNRPELWFLDEPTSGLDPTTSARIKEIILQRRGEGATVFMTTHNMYIAEELCDRVAFIDEGRIVVSDTPRALKLRYGQRLVRVEYGMNGSQASELLALDEPEGRTRLRALVDEARVETMHTQEATLEQIFIKLTGKELA